MLFFFFILCTCMVLVTFSIQMLRHVREINILWWYFSDVFSLFLAFFIKFQFSQKYKINLISVSEWFPYKCVISIKYASDVFSGRWNCFQLLTSNISLRELLWIWILPSSTCIPVENKIGIDPWKFRRVLERKILASEINLISDI